MFNQTRPQFGGGTGFSFGSTNNNKPGFGSSSSFGRPAFGAPQNQTSGFSAFGTTNTSTPSLFGTQAQQPTGGLFGQTQNPTSGFGGTSTGFGGGGLFVSQANTSGSTSLFGSNTPSTFNTSQQKGPFTFGTATTSAGTGLFGANTGSLFSTSTGGFGATNTPVGTTVKYAPVTGTDTMNRNNVSTNIQTKIEVITCMKEYENKSLEELRVEDLLAGRKGPSQGSVLGGFGQPTTATPQTGGLFGTQPTSGTSLFGTKPAENRPLFGTNTNTGFGTGTGTSGGGLFGTSTAATGFGQPSTAAPTTSFSFGQPNKTTGSFGFGTSNTTTPSLFGQPQQQPNTSGFGGFSSFGTSTSGGGLFNQNKPAFGAPTTSAGLFNKPAGTAGFGTSGFGTAFGTSSSAMPFGTNTNTSATGLFANQNKNTFSFGPTTGGFGNTTTNFNTGSGGLFGQNNQAKTGTLNFGTSTGFGTTNTTGGLNFGGTNTGLFGATNNFNTGTSGTGFGTSFNTGIGMPQMPQTNTFNTGGAINSNNISNLIKALTHNPFGNSSLLKNGIAPSGKANELISSSTSNTGETDKSTSLKPTYVLPSTNNVNKPRPVALNKINGYNNKVNNIHGKQQLFVGLDDSTDTSLDDSLKPRSYPSVKKLNLKVFNSQKNNNNTSQYLNDTTQVNGSNSPAPLTTPIILPLTTPAHPSLPPSHENSPTPDIIKAKGTIKRLSCQPEKNVMDDTIADLNVASRHSSNASGGELQVASPNGGGDLLDDEANKENHNISIFDTSSIDDIQNASNLSNVQQNAAAIKLTRKGYYTLPSIDELVDLVEDNRCLVENFTVGRAGYGNVCFLGVTDVFGLDLDRTVFIVRKEIEVYPDGSEKPPQNQGLNKPAIITLDCVWPVDKNSREVIKTPDRLEAMHWSDYLERQCVKMESTFIEYRPETGSWVFKVKHFSKYGLQDEEDDAVMVHPSSAATDVAIAGSKPPSAMTTLGCSGMSMDMSTRPPGVGSPAPMTGMFSMRSSSSGPPTAALAMTSPPVAPMSSAAALIPSQIPTHAKHFFKYGLDEEEEVEDDSSLVNQSLTAAEPMSFSGKAASAITSNLDSSLASMDVISRPPRVGSPALMTGLFSMRSSRGTSSDILGLSSSPPAPLLSAPTLAPLQKSTHSYKQAPDPESGIVEPQHLGKLIPYNDSIIKSYDRCLADMAAFKGRSFRVGWGPGWTMVHGGPSMRGGESQAEAPSVEEEQEQPPPSFLFYGHEPLQITRTKVVKSAEYLLTIEQLNLDDQFKPRLNEESMDFDTLTETSLNHILACSNIVRDEISDSDNLPCPLFHPKRSVDLLHHLASSADQLEHLEGERSVSTILNLCVALWGNIPFYSPQQDGDGEYNIAMARVEALSQWLECVVGKTVEEEVDQALQEDTPSSYLHAVYAHLTARQISQACVLAQQKGDHHLALLLSQACMGQDAPRQIMSQQLDNWAEAGTDAMMDTIRLVLYSIVAAKPTHQASHTTVNTCQGIDWKRAFALHLWYICPSISTISEVLETYEEAAGLVDYSEKYCEEPFPAYLKDKVSNGYRDVCYHLLKLYTDSTHRLEELLSVGTITPDPLDVTVSWILWNILQSLGYHHLSEVQSCSLHINMSSLLECTGQWHWAVFPLLSIKNEARRCVEVKRLIGRHVVVTSEDAGSAYMEREKFLLNKLFIPSKWLHEAKAIKARSLGLLDEEAWYLLKAGDYNRAHTLIIDTIAPNAIINEDHQYLQTYLDEMSTEEVRSHILEWVIGGSVYANYLEVCALVDEMKKSRVPTAEKVEKLRPRLLALCSHLNNLKCPTSKHRLCISEMSRVVVGVLRAVLGEEAESGDEQVGTTQVLAQQISSLPLTHDYALDELNLIITQYLTQLSRDNS